MHVCACIHTLQTLITAWFTLWARGLVIYILCQVSNNALLYQESPKEEKEVMS